MSEEPDESDSGVGPQPTEAHAGSLKRNDCIHAKHLPSKIAWLTLSKI